MPREATHCSRLSQMERWKFVAHNGRNGIPTQNYTLSSKQLIRVAKRLAQLTAPSN